MQHPIGDRLCDGAGIPGVAQQAVIENVDDLYIGMAFFERFAKRIDDQFIRVVYGIDGIEFHNIHSLFPAFAAELSSGFCDVFSCNAVLLQKFVIWP